jgi:hypothetical protein
VVLTLETQAVTLPPRHGQTCRCARSSSRSSAICSAHAYMQAPLAFDKTLVMISGFCSICTFQWIIDLLVAC